MGFKHGCKEFVKDAPSSLWIMLGVILALGAIGLVVSVVEAEASETVNYPTDKRCFNAKQWGPAPDSIRPCVKLYGNAPEAGAVQFAVSDASGVVRYSGYVNTPFHHVAIVHVTRLAEDGSFTWIAVNRAGYSVSASVGNLQD